MTVSKLFTLSLLLARTSAFNIIARVPASITRRVSTLVLEADAKDVDAAAAAVKKAAARFGAAQSDAAKAWVDMVASASDLDKLPTEGLLNDQVLQCDVTR